MNPEKRVLVRYDPPELPDILRSITNPQGTNNRIGAFDMPSMYSVSVFLADHGLSRSLFYRLVKEGRGPRLAKVGRRTLISAEAAAEWRERMQRQTEQASAPPAKANAGKRRARRETAGAAVGEAA
jgi:predicted DNA-binding transcriptional regulator AlpA